jgi:hypothetical protein
VTGVVPRGVVLVDDGVEEADDSAVRFFLRRCDEGTLSTLSSSSC